MLQKFRVQSAVKFISADAFGTDTHQHTSEEEVDPYSLKEFA
jgi:hypothetical protein